MHQAERARRRLTIATRTRLLDNLNIVAREPRGERDKRTKPALPPEGDRQKFWRL